MNQLLLDSPTDRIIVGDCIAEMKKMPSQSVDLVFADPPYNVGKDYGDKTDDARKLDDYVDWCKLWFAECKRITRYSVVITPSIVFVPEWVGRIERTHKIIAWVKENNNSRNYIGKTSGYQCYEPILVYGKPNKCVPRDVYNIPTSQQADVGDHPCPKPLGLLKKIIEDFTDEGDTVLDPFVGSGTTAVAAKLLWRHYIGIDIEQKFADIAIKRLTDLPIHPRPVTKKSLDAFQISSRRHNDIVSPLT